MVLVSKYADIICQATRYLIKIIVSNRDTAPLPDTGQWLLLALNEKLPATIVQILRARIIGLHHYLMLFVMLAFSVLFESIKAPGLGIGARYMFTMGIGRLLRAISFGFTILPSPRPWCAASRFHVPAHANRWAQKYYVPYASDINAIRNLINQDMAYGMTSPMHTFHVPDRFACHAPLLIFFITYIVIWQGVCI